MSAGAVAAGDAERRLVSRVYTRCNEFIQEACRSAPAPEEFLGALTANESGGDATAVRFEPSVYRRLRAVAAGELPRYGGITAPALSHLADEDLRELASSWGFVQIMGLHVLGRNRTVRDLLDPRFHYQFANQLLAEFAKSYQLDLSRDFEKMFRCWNSGRPEGRTADPAYVEKGLRRMELYREAGGNGDLKFQI
jgi:hypothetical protein